MSPRTILTGLHINHDKHCMLEFGSYIQIHEEHDNSLTVHTSGTIALRPTGNMQGTHYLYQKFGERGNDAVSKELRQLHDRKALVPVLKDDLSSEDKKKALSYLMFIKEKRDGAVKPRGCADGRPQRQYTNKGDASSLMVSLEAMMMSCCIDAKEGQYVVVTDIPGAFLHADMKDCVHMIMEGTVAEHVAKLEPSIYIKYRWHDKKGKLMLYVRLRKALYGMLQVALLFWQLLSITLVSWGFTINPYDQCVANKEIEGRQCTIVWHVDDLKISHVSRDVVEGTIECLNKRFGRESPLTMTRGKVLEYLGLTLDYSQQGKVIISIHPMMIDLNSLNSDPWIGLVK